MSVIGLTKLNSLLDAAASEFDAWRQSDVAQRYPASRLDYIAGKLHAMHGTGQLGPLVPGFALVFSSLDDLSLQPSDVSASLAQLAKQFDERQAHELRSHVK